MFYALGQQAALIKLGMKLTFDNPQAAKDYYDRRETVSKWTGTAGDLAGGIAGSAVGTVGGLPGNVAGGIAGAELGGRAASFTSDTVQDTAHDMGQRTKDTYQNSVSRMNAAAGMPTGVK